MRSIQTRKFLPNDGKKQVGDNLIIIRTIQFQYPQHQLCKYRASKIFQLKYLKCTNRQIFSQFVLTAIYHSSDVWLNKSIKAEVNTNKK